MPIYGRKPNGEYEKISSIFDGQGQEVKKVYAQNGRLVYDDPKHKDWRIIRQMVRKGLAPTLYPIGTVFYDNFDPETGTAFEVIAYDKFFDPGLTEQGYTHSMTLAEVYLTDVFQFDAVEAFLYLETALEPGTYRFTIPNYDATYGGNKTYYFTTTKNVPVGGQLVMTWKYQMLPTVVASYESSSATTAIESGRTLTGWTSEIDATDLGTIGGPEAQSGTSSYGQMNHIHRARYGSSNYYQSGVRQYLNATTAANTWWEPQTVFDRPYDNRNQNGKLMKLDQSMVSMMTTPTFQSRANPYFEAPSLDGTTFTTSTNYSITTDKLFLLSPKEVNLNTDSVGVILDKYVGAQNADRIKLRESNNSPYYWWLRTPHPSSANFVRGVSTSGALNYYRALNSYGLSSACNLQ